MIVRKYTRRSRFAEGGPATGQSFSDPILLDSSASMAEDSDDLLDLTPPFSQPQSHSKSLSQSQSQSQSQGLFHQPHTLAFSSSQDSSPWSFDPFLDLHPPKTADHDDKAGDDPYSLPSLPFLDDLPSGEAKVSKKRKNSKIECYEIEEEDEEAEEEEEEATTTTLMEAQEFGEMMEHVDEVNFALDGLRSGQPSRIRRASLLSLLSVCGSAAQRRLLRAQGMAAKIVDAILGLNFDDSPSMLAAAALFYCLASDIKDDHLLDSPACIRFLLKLLNPPVAKIDENKTRTVGSKLLGIRKFHMLDAKNKATDESIKAIMSKVFKILLSSKEIKSGNEELEELERPELSSKWIALSIMEKACLSAVSFEDTCDLAKSGTENFKENLRAVGGLEAIYDVLILCHSDLEAWSKRKTLTSSQLKDESLLQSLVYLLKCFKVMENATFLSKDNQDYLLMLKRQGGSGLVLSFVEIIISAIKFLSEFSMLQSASAASGKKDTLTSQSRDLKMKENSKGDDEPSTSAHAECSVIEKDSRLKNFRISHKRQKLSISNSEDTISGSQMFIDCPSVSCGMSSSSSGDCSMNNKYLRDKLDSHGPKFNSVKLSGRWISIKANCSKKNLDVMPRNSDVSRDILAESQVDTHDPFAFDDEEIEPSKWDLLAKKKKKSHVHEEFLSKKRFQNGHKLSVTAEDTTSQLTCDRIPSFCENVQSSVREEDSNILEDCLLTSVKVLINLTNDNPVGCEQIASFGGLETMVSLIARHFPSFDFSIPPSADPKGKTSFPIRGINLGHKHLRDHELDFLVAILGLLVNLVEKDSRNRLRLVSAYVSVNRPGDSKEEIQRNVIPLLCSIFLVNQGNGENRDGKALLSDDEDSLLQGEREAEKMIIEAYAALVLAFLSTESTKVRKAIASCLPKQNLQVLVPVLERFLAFHLTLNMIPPETHSAVVKVIESCKVP